MSGGRRLLECVVRWPECYTLGYDPRCCRFPKSCSAGVYGDGTDESLLEPEDELDEDHPHRHQEPRPDGAPVSTYLSVSLSVITESQESAARAAEVLSRAGVGVVLDGLGSATLTVLQVEEENR